MATKYTHVSSEPGEHSNAIRILIWLRDGNALDINLSDGHLARADDILDLVIDEKKEKGLPSDCQNIFSIWLVSPLLEIKLKNHHIPFQLAQLWDDFCKNYTDASEEEITRDEPIVMFQRNVFLTLEEEMQISNEYILKLLYHEAKYNVLRGRYLMDPSDYHNLAAIQARLDPKFLNVEKPSVQYREGMNKFYPPHVYKRTKSLMNKGGDNEKPCEELFVESHKRIIGDDLSEKDLYRQYLHICWQYSFYGSAFFEGTIEKPCHKMKKTVLGSQKTEIICAINTDGITVLNTEKTVVLLAVPYEELSWNLDTNEDEDLLPCLLVQFTDKETDATHGLPIYSRQARLIDALIDTSIKMKKKKNKQTDQSLPDKPGLVSEERCRNEMVFKKCSGCPEDWKQHFCLV